MTHRPFAVAVCDRILLSLLCSGHLILKPEDDCMGCVEDHLGCVEDYFGCVEDCIGCVEDCMGCVEVCIGCVEDWAVWKTV